MAVNYDKKPATPATLLQKEVIQTLNLIGFKAWINKNGGVWDPKGFFRQNTTGLNGVSDVLGIQKGSGRLIAVELKASKGDKLSPDQILFLDDIEKAGGLTAVVKNMDDLYKWLYKDCRQNYDRLDMFTRRKFETKNLPPKPRI